MSKALSLFSLVVAALLTLVFGLDLATTIPFERVSVAMDVCVIVAGLALAYMGWESYREQG